MPIAAATSVRLYLKPGRDDPVVPACRRRCSGSRRRATVRGATCSRIRSASSGVGRDRHAPFAGRDRLVGVEGEAADGRRVARRSAARRPPRRPPGRRKRVRGVLDDPEPLCASAKARSAGDVHHQAADVDRDDPDRAARRRPSPGACAAASASSLRLGVVEVDVERHRVAVDQDRDGAEVPHDLGRGGERHGRDEDGLAAPSGRAPRRPGGGPRWHELTATACGAPTAAANSSSKRLTRGPVVSQPERSAETTSWTSSSPISGRK